MTIKDLAAQTGYSVGTVSRVLNHQPHVSELAREIILKAAEESGFQLNENARQLKQQQSNSLLVICKGNYNELFDELLIAIQSRVADTQYTLIVDYIDESENEVRRAVRLCREKKPQGILFLGGDDRLFARSFENIRLPSVLLTSDASELEFHNLSSVTTDDAAAAQCAIEHLFSMGHDRIGIISGDITCSGPSRRRYEGCCRAYEERGMSLWVDYCVQSPFSMEGGYRAAQALLERHNVTAIFAMSDVMAIGAIRGLTDLGLRVPEDVSVIGYDGIEMGNYYIPKLTTIGQQADLLAKRGLRLLLEGIEKHSPASHEKVPYELVLNASVARKD